MANLSAPLRFAMMYEFVHDYNKRYGIIDSPYDYKIELSGEWVNIYRRGCSLNGHFLVSAIDFARERGLYPVNVMTSYRSEDYVSMEITF